MSAVQNRGTQAIRQWRILRLIASSRYMTVNKLSEHSGVSKKTIRRDIQVMETAGFPLYSERGDYGVVLYRLDKDWFLREPQETK